MLARRFAQNFLILGEGKLPVNPFRDLLEFQFPLYGTVT
jgi:hypothetical protein